jgi:tetratricopeptide (TPR) repeat protein
MKTESICRAAILTIFILSSLCIPISAYSSDAIGWFEQGNTYLNNKNYTQAVQAYDHAIMLDPNYFEALNAKADALNRAGQFNAALGVSDQLIALKPDYVKGWINRGYILYNLGRYSDELNAYETAISIDPSSPDAWFNKGYSLAGMKRYDEAIAAFDKVQALDSAYPNLAANRRIAEQNRDAAIPLYVRYAPAIAVTAIIVVSPVIWYIAVRKKY